MCALNSYLIGGDIVCYGLCVIWLTSIDVDYIECISLVSRSSSGVVKCKKDYSVVAYGWVDI